MAKGEQVKKIREGLGYYNDKQAVWPTGEGQRQVSLSLLPLAPGSPLFPSPSFDFVTCA